MAEIEPGPDTPRWRAVIRYLTDNGSLRHKPPATSGPGQPQRRGTPLLRCRGALILCLTEEEMAMSDQRGVRLTGRDERGRNWGATIWGPDPQEGETLKGITPEMARAGDRALRSLERGGCAGSVLRGAPLATIVGRTAASPPQVHGPPVVSAPCIKFLARIIRTRPPKAVLT